MSGSAEGEVVFVVDVSSFTGEGFIGTSNFAGEPVSIVFDDGEDGIFLNHEMARRLGAKKGSRLSVLIEADKTQLAKAEVAAVGDVVRISDPKVYYAIGKEGGAVIRMRKS